MLYNCIAHNNHVNHQSYVTKSKHNNHVNHQSYVTKS